MSNIVHQQFVSSFGANHFQFALCLLNPTCVNFSVFAIASEVYPEISASSVEYNLELQGRVRNPQNPFCEVLPRNALK